MHPAVTRILVLTNLYPPHAIGGYERTCRDAVERFVDRGHHVEVLTSSWRSPEGDAAPLSDARVHRDLTLTSTFVAPRPRALRWSTERANLRRLQDQLTRARPDVVSIWNMAGMSLGLLPVLARSGLPLVYVVSDDWPVGCVDRDPWMSAFRNRPALGRFVTRVTGVPTRLPDLGPTGRFCFNSDWLRRRCSADGPWSFRDADVVWPGVDGEDFPLELAPSTEPFAGRLLFVGRIDATKGVETLVRALRSLPPAMTLEIVGVGDEIQTAALDRLVVGLGLADRVRRLTEPRHRLAAHYRQADVCVFPSEWDEPFGLVPLEAMTCGTPVVATGTGGSAEYLRDGENCVLFAPGDAEALGAALLTLAGDADLRRRLVDGGRRTAAGLTADVMADKLAALHVAAIEVQSRSVR